MRLPAMSHVASGEDGEQSRTSVHSLIEIQTLLSVLVRRPCTPESSDMAFS